MEQEPRASDGARVAEGPGDDVESRVGRSGAAGFVGVLRGCGAGHGCLAVVGGVQRLEERGQVLGVGEEAECSRDRSPSRWVSISSPR